MGRPKGHAGATKPEAEKLDKPFRIGFNAIDRELVKQDAKRYGLDVSKYFRMLWVADHSKNA